MKTDILIVGGGLSGLVATWRLTKVGVDVLLIEARDRFGGRAYTVDPTAHCDLGPSWFWRGQPIIPTLLNHFNIPFYEQYADGIVLFQQADGRIMQSMDGSPMAGSLRIEGGVGRLANAIANEIDPKQRLLEHVATGVSHSDSGVVVDVTAPSGMVQIEAQRVALAMPPRLAAGLTFTPPLPQSAVQPLTNMSTWMSGHAKFFAVYDRPFWREKGLCGTAISRRGPLAEIHDASPASGDQFSLFGFAGLDAHARAEMGQDAFTQAAIAQLVTLFGEDARHPTAVYVQDWSTERFTAAPADRAPQTRHPQYGLPIILDPKRRGVVDFISSETSFSNGGLIEGALEAGLYFARRATGIGLFVEEDNTIDHHASMDWDWL